MQCHDTEIVAEEEIQNQEQLHYRTFFEILDKIQCNANDPDLKSQLQLLSRRRNVAFLCLLITILYEYCFNELFSLMPRLHESKRAT